MLTADALLHDQGGFAYVNRVDGEAVELIRLPPHTVVLRYDLETGEPIYNVSTTSGVVTYNYRDILHVRAPSSLASVSFMPTGLAPISLARNAIALAAILEQHATNLFGNGAYPGGLLKETPEGLTGANAEVAKKNFLQAFVDKHGGAANSGKPLVLPRGIDWIDTALSSVDAQFLEMRRHQNEEIARAFRVPPTMLFDLTRGTWANSESMQRQFLTFTVRPWLDAWCWAYARVLLTPEEQINQYVEFNTDDLLSADFAARMTGYAQAIAARILNPNEARAAENRPSYPEGNKFENPNTTPAANTNLAPSKDAAA